MFIALLQGGIGYLQYFNEVPELLVGAHIAGATALWVATVQLVLVTHARARTKRAIDETGRVQVSGLAAETV
jgi:cytochrome c oxidase assembly protein subunit 15